MCVKTRLLSILLLLPGMLSLEPLSAQSMLRSFNAATGPVGWWRVCGDTTATSGCLGSTSTVVHDSSGYGNDGVWNGSFSGTGLLNWYSPGYIGPYAGNFQPPHSNYISVPAGVILFNNSATTVTVWLFLSSFTGQSVNYPIANGSGGAGDGWSFGVQGTFNVCTTSGYVYVFSNNAPICTTSPISANIWTFLAFTYDGTNMRIYVNGVLKANSPASFAWKATNPLNIGRRTDGAWYIAGAVNDVRVYNRVLGAGELAQMALAHN